MSENKFLSFVFFQGILYLITGLCMLILPKISPISFGFILCTSFLFIGGYHLINTFFTRNLSKHFILDLILGIILFISGLILLFAPILDIMIIISLIGCYFIIKSISSLSFGVQTRKILNFWWLTLLLSFIELLFGVLTIISIPTGAFWLTGLVTGIDFILSGFVLLNMFISTNYIKQE